MCARRVDLSTKNTTTDDSLFINIEMLVSCSVVSFVDPTFIYNSTFGSSSDCFLLCSGRSACFNISCPRGLRLRLLHVSGLSGSETGRPELSQELEVCLFQYYYYDHYDVYSDLQNKK